MKILKGAGGGWREGPAWSEAASTARAATRAVLDAVYPNSIYCLCCGKVIDETRMYSLCDKCIRDIHWADKTCEKCGRILSENWQGSICASCMQREQVYDKGFSCMQYGIHARAIIFEYKYGDKPYIARFMACAMGDRLRLAACAATGGAGESGGENASCVSPAFDSAHYDIVTFVPTEKEKAKERGFDHAQLLAKRLADELGLACERTLVRTKKTRAQRGLNPYERQANVSGAFAVSLGATGEGFTHDTLPHGNEPDGLANDSRILSSKRILLVDDIFTTGSTLNECARVLKKAGAGRVDFITFAATPNVYTDNDMK